MFILDTDVVIDILRGYPPAVAWLESLGDEEIALPGFVVMELIQGCRDKREQKRLEQRIMSYGILWPEPEHCNHALATFANLHLVTNIGIMDVLIAQIALAADWPLCTFNEKHYSAIPGLRTVQPYKRG